MTENEFRKLALSFAEAIESSHFNHPDFRAGGKIFASIAKPAEKLAMVKLTPEQQASFMKLDEAFSPCAGAWGKRGYTNIALPRAKKALVKSALEIAYDGVMAGKKEQANKGTAAKRSATGKKSAKKAPRKKKASRKKS